MADQQLQPEVQQQQRSQESPLENQTVDCLDCGEHLNLSELLRQKLDQQQQEAQNQHQQEEAKAAAQIQSQEASAPSHGEQGESDADQDAMLADVIAPASEFQQLGEQA